MILEAFHFCMEHVGIWWTFAVLGLLGVLVKMKTSRRPTPVFGAEFLLPRKPIERSQNTRASVLEESIKVNKVTSTPYDVIVVGSGPAGLSTGVLLSRLGYRVLVLEQHDRAGGTCHTFTEKGFEFDTGVHYLGNLGPGEMFRTMLDQLTRGQVHFNVLDDAFDQVVVASDDGDSSRWYQVLSGQERCTGKLIQYFPEEKDAIETFMRVMTELTDAANVYVILKMVPVALVKLLDWLGVFSRFVTMCRGQWHKMTLQEFVTGLTDNVDLQRLFTYMTADMGALPMEMNVVTYSFLFHHYVGGAYYPIGGPQEIPYHMCAEIKERGGQVLVNARVKNIVCNSEGEAVGVRMEKPDVEIRAKTVVSSAGFANTFHKLLPKHVAQKSEMYPLVDDIGPSNSCVSIFVGLDGTPEELGLPSGNVWLFRDGYTSNNGFNLMYNTKYEDLPDDFCPPIVYFAPCSAKNPDSKNTMPGKSTLILLVLCNSEWFSEWHDERKGHRGQAYEDRKADLADRTWKRCLTVFPHLAGQVLYKEVGTSATNKHFLGSTEGEMYNLNMKRSRFGLVAQSQMRPETGIPGLYVTGTDLLCAGMVSAMFTAIVTVSKITNRNLIMEFQKVHKNFAKTGRV